MDRPLVLLLGIACAMAGCGRAGTSNPATPAGRAALAELPGVRASPHRGLVEELALVEQDGGLPLQLAPKSRTAKPGTASQRPSEAEALHLAFPPLSRQLVVTPLDEIYAGGPLTLSSVQVERGRELVRKHAAAGERFRAAMPSMAQGFGPRLCDGILADLAFLEPLSIGCRLEAVAAAVRLADDAPAEALPHLKTMLEAARVLAEEPNVTTRVAAANVRADALEVLAAIAGHDAATPETHQQLLALLTETTTDWPADSRAWRGDRAGGLLVYELVRDGQYLSLLAADEVQQLHERNIVRATAEAAARNVDEDQQFYLRAMRQLIDACGRPYFERQTVLAEVREQLTAKEQTADHPLIATTLLLTDFETGHRRQAEDFARCQAWMLALGTALGQEPPAAVANPLTGSPYKIDRTPLAVTVSSVLLGEDQPCVVPVISVAARPN